ncbi:MAG: patatin-like phospholipase family protein [Hyphomicrobiales bacterium]
MAKPPIDIILALQGGGSHGALAWGVIERFLVQPELRIAAITGTSAGAMNGAMVAQGMAEGGADRAQKLLQIFWAEIAKHSLLSPFQRTAQDRATGDWSLDRNPAYVWFELITRIWSPYQGNPLNFNPLRDILTEIIDLDRLNADDAPRLYITATNVRTGQPTLFTQPNLSIDAILASAALPTLFHAVQIDGEAYWDGGYTGNPALFPVVRDLPGRDLILVQTNPFERDPLPKTAPEIANRLNEITFNAALLKELRVAVHARERYGSGSSTRLHRVLCDEVLTEYSPSSKLNGEGAYLKHLYDLGFQRAADFLFEHGTSLGVKETFDPSSLFQDPNAPSDLLEAAE